MKIRRSVLKNLVREELAKHVRSLVTEAEDKKVEPADANDDKKGKEEKGGKGEKTPVKPQNDPDNSAGKPKSNPPAGAAPAKELPTTKEPVDDELEADVASGGDGDKDGEAEAEEVTGGNIAKELAGKTVQSITMEPKSKLMPGAQEIVLTFDQITDPLRILVNKSGVVKFYFKGLQNQL